MKATEKVIEGFTSNGKGRDIVKHNIFLKEKEFCTPFTSAMTTMEQLGYEKKPGWEDVGCECKWYFNKCLCGCEPGDSDLAFKKY